jgi:hypothetical protein
MRIKIPTNSHKGSINFLSDRTFCDLGIWGNVIWSLNCWMEKGGEQFVNSKPRP